jgi:hypothetical protein
MRQDDDMAECPEMPMWKAVRQVAAATGDADRAHCFPETLRAIRRAAAESQLTIWGKRQVANVPPPGRASDAWTAIDAGFWRDHLINALAAEEIWDASFHSDRDPFDAAASDRYWSLRVGGADIDRLWPASGEPSESGGA